MSTRFVIAALAAAAGVCVASAPACERGDVGDPCVPDRESGDPSFTGFSADEVSVDSRSMECRTRTCLVNHFQGRVHDSDAAGVRPRCSHRPVADAVYCSCRCANVDGRTDDGSVYCRCPDGFTCTQLVSSIGARDEGVTGAYCIASGTAYAPGDCP